MKTKKISQLILRIFLVYGIMIANVRSVVAQTDIKDNISFTELSETDISLQGPLDVYSFGFRIPTDWALLDGGQLHLNFSAFVSNDGSSSWSSVGTPTIAGFLQVKLNGNSLGTIVIGASGENSVDIPIYTSAWDLTDPTDSHRLEFTLRTPGPCNADSLLNSSASGGLNVVIHPTSHVYIPHNSVPVSVDLRKLPSPIYQDSFVPNNAILVLPDDPTEMELQAAFTTAAIFGRTSSGLLNLETTTISKLDSARLAASHVIFVGKLSAFPQFTQTFWPAPFASGRGFENIQPGTDDGVIQMAISPQNSAYAWLMVSGINDVGVVKAAQALSRAGEIRVYENPGISIVTGAQTAPVVDLNSVDRTFADLGYGNQDLSGPGIRYSQYIFHIPDGQVVSPGASLDLVFAHSAMLDFNGAGVSVSLNGDYIGSLRFSEQTAQVTSWHLNLPSSSFRQGENKLLLAANLVATSSCLPTNQLWFSSRSDSALHMPLMPAPIESPKLLLRKYPSPFTPSLDKTAFIVSRDDSDAWGVSSRVAFDLGNKTSGSLINLAVAFADSVPDGILKERDLILIGRPSSMPIMQDLKSTMPAPFDPGSDIANEVESGSAFRVADNTSVGYLQVFPAPWDALRSVMAVSGNGAEGVKWAADALILSDRFSQLSGNFTVIYADQIIPFQVDTDNVTILGTPAVVATQTLQAEQTAASQSPAESMFLNVVVIVVLVAFALIVLGYFVWRKPERRSDN